MNPNQQQIDNLYAQAQGVQQGINQYAKSKGKKLTQQSGGAFTASPITTNQLQPVQPFNLNSQPSQVPSSGLEGTINSSVSSYKAQSESERLIDEQSKAKSSSLDSYMQSVLALDDQVAQAQNVDRAEQNAAKAESDRLTSAIEEEQKAVLRKVQRMEKNPTGMLAGALEAEIEKVNRESIAKQADLAISQNIARRNFDSAKDVADQAVQDKLAPLKIKQERLKEFYDINRENMDSDFKLRLEQKIKAEDRAIEKEENLQQTIMDLKIEAAKSGNSSVMTALSKVDTTNPKAFDEILKIAAPVMALSANEITEVGGRKAIVNKLTGTVKYLDGGTGVTTRTVNGQPVDGYTLIAGDDPYFIAQQYGTDMNNLKALNPNISNWNNIQPGAVINVPSKDAGRTEALATILGSSKFTKDQVALVTNAINNGQDPFTVVKNQAKDIMGQTLATELDKYETAKSQLTSIDSLLKDYYAKGGKTGYLTGNYEKTINGLGTISDPALVSIATNIASALQIYRNAVSGTAYSVQEGKDIASIFPGINKSSGLNNAIVNGRLQAFDTTIDQKYRNTLGGAYDTLKNSSKPQVDPIQNIKSYGEANPAVRSTLIQMQNDGMTVEQISNWINQRQ